MSSSSSQALLKLNYSKIRSYSVLVGARTWITSAFQGGLKKVPMQCLRII